MFDLCSAFGDSFKAISVPCETYKTKNMKYRLLKDTINALNIFKKGRIVEYSNGGFYYDKISGDIFTQKLVENNPEWFEKIDDTPNKQLNVKYKYLEELCEKMQGDMRLRRILDGKTATSRVSLDFSISPVGWDERRYAALNLLVDGVVIFKESNISGENSADDIKEMLANRMIVSAFCYGVNSSKNVLETMDKMDKPKVDYALVKTTAKRMADILDEENEKVIKILEESVVKLKKIKNEII